jgi:hypothetical protein
MGSPRVSWRAKADFAAYGGQLLFPPLLLGALAGALTGGRRGLAAALLGLYGAAAAALAWDALRWDAAADEHRPGVGERAVRSLRAAAFGAVWLAAVPAALWRLATRRGAVLYDKMTREGVRS